MANQNPDDAANVNTVQEIQVPVPTETTIDPANIRPGFDQVITDLMQQMAEALDYLATR